MTRTASALPASVLAPVLALAGIGLAVPAAAQSSRPAMLAQVRAEFAATDIDRDGTLSKAEVAARIDKMKMAGAARPLNAAQARQLTELWFRGTDANGDGRVTLAEAEATAAQLFDRYDTNHDGIVSPAERAAAHANLKPPAAAPKGR